MSIDPLPFHPIVTRWFRERFGQPTDPQRMGWPAILSGRHTLIVAPTGSGKTLAAFLACIDALFRQAVDGTLGESTQVVYISPLKALASDIERNLAGPLAQIQDLARREGLAVQPLRVHLRTGDTSASARTSQLRHPPHILVTTPESLYLLLTAPKARLSLAHVRTVIVDEIHALARDKRGAHLALSLERLEALVGDGGNIEAERASPGAPLMDIPQRIGLSATVKPTGEIARFLVGAARVNGQGEAAACVIDAGSMRRLDLGIEVPPSDLAAVCPHETWEEIDRQLADLIARHRSTLVFVNTRRLAERLGVRLRAILGQDAVASHHGSLARHTRQDVEERLRAGQLKAIVATASLELGIDIGFVDLVCQMGSPRSIATFLQRVGRSGHSLGRTPRGRIFPLTRDELLEAMALVRAIRADIIDGVEIPRAPIDILTQQIVAETAARDWNVDRLFERYRRAWPYRDMTHTDFDDAIHMLAGGFVEGGRRNALVQLDPVTHALRARRGARILAATSGGAIPEMAEFRVVTEGDRTLVGMVNEDFATETMGGDIFQLGNASWRVRHVRQGEVVVTDAGSAPANIPFWFGEAPARTHELSEQLSTLRAAIDAALETSDEAAVTRWLEEECAAGIHAAQQAVGYVAAQRRAVAVVPTTRRILVERFFDEVGGLQVVIHAPLGARINRAWGLALRKKFCRTFDFELQASADDDGIALSLGPQHSFPLERLSGLVRRANAVETLEQAVLASGLFTTRWRWNVTRALAVPRFAQGRRVPPAIQRFRADDLLVAAFPAQTACQDNRVGDVAVPDHPLIRQSLFDCLHEAMDVDGWVAFLDDLESSRLEVVTHESTEPSPFAHRILNANPYSFLDDAPLEERRARAVAMRRTLPADAADLAALDPAAIARVLEEVAPDARDPDELYDALAMLVVLPASEGTRWTAFFDALRDARRATCVTGTGGPDLWVAIEHVPLVRAAFPGAGLAPAIDVPPDLSDPVPASRAIAQIVRARMEVAGPTTAGSVGASLGIAPVTVDRALEGLEAEGVVLRGRFTPRNAEPSRARMGPASDGLVSAGLPSCATSIDVEWCERRLLARIHRLTLDALRRQIEPVGTDVLVRFLLEHQHLTAGVHLEGRRGLVDAIAQLQGFEAPAGSWETEILTPRVADYQSGWLDEISHQGLLTWGRLQPPRRDPQGPAGSGPLTRVIPIALALREDLEWLLPPDRAVDESAVRGNARQVLDALHAHGALFASDLVRVAGLLPVQVDDALGALSALGCVTSDGFSPIRTIAAGQRRRREQVRRRARLLEHGPMRGWPQGGRWSLFPGPVFTGPLPSPLIVAKANPRAESAVARAAAHTRAKRWVWQLLSRYGLLFRDLLAREPVAPHWPDLVSAARLLEAQGQIRGGRFVAGVSGEQFALPATVDRLRQLRVSSSKPAASCDATGAVSMPARAGTAAGLRTAAIPPLGDAIVLSAADPLNLAGVLESGPRVPSTHTNRVLIAAGRFIASLQAGEIHVHTDLPHEHSGRVIELLGKSAAVSARRRWPRA